MDHSRAVQRGVERHARDPGAGRSHRPGPAARCGTRISAQIAASALRSAPPGRADQDLLRLGPVLPRDGPGPPRQLQRDRLGQHLTPRPAQPAAPGARGPAPAPPGARRPVPGSPGCSAPARSGWSAARRPPSPSWASKTSRSRRGPRPRSRHPAPAPAAARATSSSPSPAGSAPPAILITYLQEVQLSASPRRTATMLMTPGSPPSADARLLILLNNSRELTFSSDTRASPGAGRRSGRAGR